MPPRHIVLFIISCLVLLGSLSLIADHAKPVLGNLRWPGLSDVFGLSKEAINTTLPNTPNSAFALSDSLTLAEDIQKKNVSKTAKHTLATTHNSIKPAVGALDHFIAALQESKERPVRVVHYGDSQIEEDRITSTIRQHLQSRYGGIGVGLIPLVQTIPTLNLVQFIVINGQRISPKEGPKRSLIYGPKNQQRSNDKYGPMGQVAIMDSLCDNLILHIEPFSKITSANRFSQVRVLSTESITVNDRRRKILSISDTLTSANLHFAGQGDVYGVSLESPTGVIVDNIPMRGGSGNVFTRMNRAQLSSFFTETNTKLIILQFGGNVMPWANTEDRVRSYAYSIRKQIRYLQSCAPNASILFIGPSDMITVMEGKKMTYPTLALMDQQLARSASAEGIAYWSLFQAMGGEGSMIKWQEKGMASTDGVHFKRSGAEKAGELLWKWLRNEIKTP